MPTVAFSNSPRNRSSLASSASCASRLSVMSTMTPRRRSVVPSARRTGCMKSRNQSVLPSAATMRYSVERDWPVFEARCSSARARSRSSGCRWLLQNPGRSRHCSTAYPSSLTAPSLTNWTFSVAASASQTITSRSATTSRMCCSASTSAIWAWSRSSVRCATSSCNWVESAMMRRTACQESGITTSRKPRSARERNCSTRLATSASSSAQSVNRLKATSCSRSAVSPPRTRATKRTNATISRAGINRP